MHLSLVPESAPFNVEQRAWLNGFLAGWLGLQEGPGQPSPLASTSTPTSTAIEPPAATAPAEDLPWHDPAMPIDERLKLAEGRPLGDRLMAAMAQLDCGACGYVCRTYSEAIAGGAETRLSLCSPGGSETSKALKRALKGERPAAPLAAIGEAPAPVATGPASSTWSRTNPFAASILRSARLNGPGSEKETRHVEIDLDGSGLSYKVGDSLGVVPTNCDDLVAAVLAALGAGGGEPVATPLGAEVPIRDALAEHCCLAEVTDGLLALLADAASDREEEAQILALLEDDGPIAGHDVLDVLQRFPTARPPLADLVRALPPLRPRLYSISSSPRGHAGQVHLTVGRVSSVVNGRVRKGVASTMLADRVAAGSKVRVFVQPSHGFTIPADPGAAMIMIGPGTGIAPFRAFLHERAALGAPGKNWLFFGDHRSACDYLYEEELRGFVASGLLTRLDTAFSRDQERKVYVQHRIEEHGEALYGWLEEGAHVFVCGDAKRMAADVDRALREVVRVHGAKTEDVAKDYLAALASSGRYLRDVY